MLLDIGRARQGLDFISRIHTPSFVGYFFRFNSIIPLTGELSQQSKIKFSPPSQIIPDAAPRRIRRILRRKSFITHFTKMQSHVYMPVLK